MDIEIIEKLVYLVIGIAVSIGLLMLLRRILHWYLGTTELITQQKETNKLLKELLNKKKSE